MAGALPAGPQVCCRWRLSDASRLKLGCTRSSATCSMNVTRHGVRFSSANGQCVGSGGRRYVRCAISLLIRFKSHGNDSHLAGSTVASVR